MKKLLAALALVSAAYVASANAADVGVSITVGQPGFYGQLDIGNYNYGPPQVVYRQPVLVERRNWYPAPVYVRVPPYQYGNWRRYCGLYGACARPVYFVRDDWYRNVYAPRYSPGTWPREWLRQWAWPALRVPEVRGRSPLRSQLRSPRL